MQQKYCDHGLSVAVLRITRPMLRARSSCGSGGKPEKGVDLALGEQLHGLAGEALATQSMSLRVEPDVASP